MWVDTRHRVLATRLLGEGTGSRPSRRLRGTPARDVFFDVGANSGTTRSSGRERSGPRAASTRRSPSPETPSSSREHCRNGFTNVRPVNAAASNRAGRRATVSHDANFGAHSFEAGSAPTPSGRPPRSRPSGSTRSPGCPVLRGRRPREDRRSGGRGARRRGGAGLRVSPDRGPPRALARSALAGRGRRRPPGGDHSGLGLRSPRTRRRSRPSSGCCRRWTGLRRAGTRRHLWMNLLMTKSVESGGGARR